MFEIMKNMYFPIVLLIVLNILLNNHSHKLIQIIVSSVLI